MTEVTELPEERAWTDRFGAVASSLCAIHCALCAIGGIFAAMSLEHLEDPGVELGLTLVAVAFGLAALYFGWRHHRSRNVLILIVAGILALGVSRGLEMGSGHDHGHGDDHQAEGEKHEGDEHHNEEDAHAEKAGEGDHEGHDDHGDGHGDGHGGILHDVGAGAGVLGGILLFLGHLANLRATRRWREECCA